jgi:hypothetical protein
MKFEFTIDETNLIMASLARMPYESVFQIIENIKQQAGPQLPQQPGPDGSTAVPPPPSAPVHPSLN